MRVGFRTAIARSPLFLLVSLVYLDLLVFSSCVFFLRLLLHPPFHSYVSIWATAYLLPRRALDIASWDDAKFNKKSRV
jgi:hypothetical protein